MDPDVAPAIEVHEAQAWARCVANTKDAPGNPLGGQLGAVKGVPLPALTALNYGLFNRVIGLGVDEPVDEADLDHLLEWYGSLQQTNFVIEVSPRARPRPLARCCRTEGWSTRASGRRRCGARPLLPSSTQP